MMSQHKMVKIVAIAALFAAFVALANGQAGMYIQLMDHCVQLPFQSVSEQQHTNARIQEMSSAQQANNNEMR
jgi:Spy/CpxP family protein refolding chaperone